MPIVETEGLVLRKYNLSDADRIVIVLTETQGLIRGVANGAKRLRSKFSGSLEFFSRINLTYFQKEDKDLVVFRDSELVENVFKHSSDPEFFETFSDIADLLIRTTPPYEVNKRLYHMTRHCLAAAISDTRFVPAVRVYFEIWLLKLGGFLPSWEGCAQCGLQFRAGIDAGIDIDFQLACAGCKNGLPRVTEEVRGHYLLAQSKSPAAFSAESLDRENVLRKLGERVSAITDAVLERMPAPRDGRTVVPATN